jgi:Rne/Rng family ribonuclease
MSEFDALRKLWGEIERRLDGSPPLCAHAEHGLRRVLCAFGGDPDLRFVFADPESAGLARALAKTVAPGFESRIAVAEEGGALFDRHGIGDAIALAEGREVPLPSGGRLSIEGTSALTAIDVDSGGGAAGPEAALTTNLEAATEIALQLRLRELGGPIVVDFIRMSRKGDQERVRCRLTEAVESDRMAVQVLGWTQGGLFELSRARAGHDSG